MLTDTPYGYLAADALEYDTDLTKWPTARQLAAAVELYKRQPAMLTDALADLGADRMAAQVREGLDLYQSDAFAGAQLVTAACIVYLREWPLAWLSERAAEYWDTWHAERERERNIEEVEHLREEEWWQRQFANAATLGERPK